MHRLRPHPQPPLAGMRPRIVIAKSDGAVTTNLFSYEIGS